MNWFSHLIQRIKKHLFPTETEITTPGKSNQVKPTVTQSTACITGDDRSTADSVSDTLLMSEPQVPIFVRPTQEEMFLQQINDARQFLGPVEGRTPDNQQMSCIITHANNHLVIAGAGTGKSSTIVAKVVYLLKTKQYEPKDFAVFSFTHDSAEEIRNRIHAETGIQIYTATFHSFAMRIVKAVDGSNPKISSLTPDSIVGKKLIYENLHQNEAILLCKYVLWGGDHIRSEFTFRTASEYIQHLEEFLPRTIAGQKVSNYGELVIANLLTIYGVAYTFYPKTHNFLLKGHNLYIEFYSANRSGSAPCYFAENTHDERILSSTDKMDYIRNLYRSNTNVIRCYSYQLFEGNLEYYLVDELQKNNISVGLCDTKTLWEYAFPTGSYSQASLAKTMSQFISGLSANNRSVQGLESIVTSKYGAHCLNPYLYPVLCIFYNDYVSKLHESRSVTFDSLLTTATLYIHTGKYVHPYKYVIVDEYQDISHAQYSFLQALRDSHHYSLFAVGDDWQSIYGFNGSCVSYIMDFKRYWGPSHISKIETTYRFPQSLVDICGKFIMANPRQIRKNIHGKASIHDPVSILFADKNTPAIRLVAKSLDSLPLNSSVFLLGRNKQDWQHIKRDHLLFEDSSDNAVIYSPRPDLSIRFMSVHASKGLEADNVIIINVIDGRYGFPNQVSNHPAYEILLDHEDPFPYAEERRLFYVALTRTRNRVFIVTDIEKQSVFVQDLVKENPDILARTTRCPLCGRVLIRVERPPFGCYDICSGFDTSNCSYIMRSELCYPE